MSRKRTALEYLIEEYKKHCDGDGLTPFEIIELAKDMEKQQIKDAFNRGYRDGEITQHYPGQLDVQYFDDAENYYNDTYTI